MRDAKVVKDLMISDVAVIRDDADVHELEKRLLKDRIHGMPVVDAKGTLVGVVSQTDLIAWHYFTGVDGVPFYSAHGPMIPYEEDSSLGTHVADRVLHLSRSVDRVGRGADDRAPDPPPGRGRR